MELLYDEDFVETAVSLCAAGHCNGATSLQIHRFHFERERIYSILDPDGRSAEFSRLHMRWFRDWGLEKRLAGTIGEFPQLETSLSVLAFRKSRTRLEEGAELYVNSASRRNGVVALRAERFGDDDRLAEWLRRELMHLADMVAPEFGYSPDLPREGPSPVRERYRLLWNISIEGRLERRFGSGQKSFFQDQFDRVFAFWPEARRREVFESLWNDESPRHERLMQMALDPRETAHAEQPIPGAPCPLCGFSTFDWAHFPKVHPRAVKAILAQFPQWTLRQGVCRRCVDVYEAAASLPLTVLPGA